VRARLRVSGVVTPTLRVIGIAARLPVIGGFVGLPARRRARRVLARLQARVRSGGGPVRVVFLVREHQKWAAESLHRALADDPHFEAVVAVSILNSAAKGPGAETLTSLAATTAHLAGRGIDAVAVHDGQRFLPLEDLDPDVVVYDQPYGLPALHRPQRIGRRALVCAIPYGFGFYLMTGSLQRVGNGLLPLAWRTFVASGDVLARLGDAALTRIPGVVATGDPKADELRRLLADAQSTQAPAQAGEAPLVIWAPHHSVGRANEGRPGQLATFRWSAPAMLELAARHPGVRFVLKPHPMLRYALVTSGTMSAGEVDALLEAWRALPNTDTHETGGYAELFLTSSAMVTDSGSFLVEYGITGRPIIHLTDVPDPVRDTRFTPLGRELLATLHRACDAEELARELETVVVRGEDPLREDRLATPLIASVRSAEDAGRAIARHLADAIHGVGAERDAG
jgi:hypothetical protein